MRNFIVVKTLNLGCLLLFLVVTTQLGATEYSILTSSYSHLCEINKQWLNYPEASTDCQIQFLSDRDRIQYHLKYVGKHLYENCPENLTEETLAKRISLLSALGTYAEAKEFPKNKYHQSRHPYFIDDNKVHCAVGYLIAASDREDLAMKIRKEHNYDYIADIKTEGLTNWAMENGFTVEELKWIQPGYAPLTLFDSLSNGTNGPVGNLYVDNWDGRLIISGEFELIDDLPCLNIGYYNDDQLSCLGTGISGLINDVFTSSEGVIVTGKFKDSGTDYPIAVYESGSWQYLGIPGRDGATGTASYAGGWDYSKEVAITHPSIPGLQEIWYLMNTGIWEKKATVNGVILDIEASMYGRIYAGSFDSVTVHRLGSADTTILVKNVVANENYTENWYSLGSEISDTVKIAQAIGLAVYLGGTCANATNVSNVCLARYLNETLQPLILSSSFSGSGANWINDIEYDNETSLMIGGKFDVYPMVGTYASNLAKYSLISNTTGAVASFNKQLTSVKYWQGLMYLGGHFTTNLTTQNLQHLARIANPVEIIKIGVNESVFAFPNPFKDEVIINGAKTEYSYSIYDLKGQLVVKGKTSQNKISNLNMFASGLYSLHLKTKDKVTIQKLVKQ